MIRRGEWLAGRFELVDDEQEIVEYRRWLPQWIRQGNLDEQRLWVRAVDRTTGRNVVYSPPIADAREVSSTAERVARDVMALGLESVVPVLHVGPGVVYAEPPPVVSSPSLTLAEAAACALSACEVVAHMHAIGHDELSFSPRHLRLEACDGGWRIAWLIPSVPAFVRLDEPVLSERAEKSSLVTATEGELEDLFGEPRPDESLPVGLREQLVSRPRFEYYPVARAQAGLARYFLSLLGKHEPRPGILRRIRDQEVCFEHVAALARLFQTFVADPDAWTASISRLPVVHELPRRLRDWDAKVGDLEASIAGWRNPLVIVQLACAYHQRACRSFAAGDANAALADVDRALALDRCVGFQTTRATLLDHLGQPAAARAEVAAACVLAESLRLGDTSDEHMHGAKHIVSRPDFARALATAGLFAVHDGDLAASEPVLRRSLGLHPTAAAAHALGAVLFRRGEIEEAVEFEARSVALEPTNARYRWALVVSLQRLGREDEAIDHALAVIRGEPDDPAHRARFARLCGG